MTKRNCNLVALFSQILSLLFLLVLRIYNYEKWVPTVLGYDVDYTRPYSFLRINIEGYTNSVWLYIILAIMGINIIILFLHLFDSSHKKMSMISSFPSFVSLALMIAFTCAIFQFHYSGTWNKYRFVPGGLFYVEALLIIATTVFSLMAYIKSCKESDNAVNTIPSTSITSTSSAEELKKYKELLDTGVITQEEFDAKKKQLLDL